MGPPSLLMTPPSAYEADTSPTSLGRNLIYNEPCPFLPAFEN
jgi:hypothetical protein